MSRLSQYVTSDLESNFPCKPVDEEYRFCCFYCGERDFKLYMNPEKGEFQCFRCGKTSRNSSFITVYAKAYSIPYLEALEKLQMYVEDDAKATVEEALDWLISKELSASQEQLPKLDSLPVGCIPWKGNESHENFKYLLDRGLTAEELEALDAHAVGDKNLYVPTKRSRVNLRNRVILPIYDPVTRDLVSWLARATHDDCIGPKYINAPGSPLAKVIAPAVFRQNSPIVISEGYIDSIAIRRTGYQCYASFGKKLSSRQIAILKGFSPTSVTVFFDQGAEQAAQTAASNLLEVFGASKVRVANPNKLPKGTDSGDTLRTPDGTALLKQIVDNAMRVDSIEYALFSSGLEWE